MRERAGLSQADLARKLKKSRSSVSEYESNAHPPSLKVLAKIARVCNGRIAELVA